MFQTNLLKTKITKGKYITPKSIFSLKSILIRHILFNNQAFSFKKFLVLINFISTVHYK